MEYLVCISIFISTFNLYHNPLLLKIQKLLLTIVFTVTVSILMGTQDVMALTFNQFNDNTKFIDISGSATAIEEMLSDDAEVTIVTTVGRTGFFESGNVCLGANGAIGEGACGNLQFTNQALPSASAFGGATAILPFWDDLNPGAGGQIFWEETTVMGFNTLIVQWHDLPLFVNIGDVRFQLQLFECGGDIAARFAYPDVVFGNQNDFGAGATIGYQADLNNADQFSFNQAVLQNDDVIDLIQSCGAVGGELLPIDNTALLLAGLQSSAIWMLPVLVVVTGLGAFYIKTRMSKE